MSDSSGVSRWQTFVDVQRVGDLMPHPVVVVSDLFVVLDHLLRYAFLLASLSDIGLDLREVFAVLYNRGRNLFQSFLYTKHLLR